MKITKFEFKFLFWSVVLATGVTLLSAWLSPFFDLSESPFVQRIVNIKAGALTFYFLYSILAAILVPIPTLPLDILSAGLFGIPIALIVRLTGGLCGATVAFFLAKRFGRPLLKKLLDTSTYQEIENFSVTKGLRAFFLISIFPLVNPEVMAYAAGLTNLRLISTLAILALANFYRFLIVMLWGRLILQNLGL